MKYADNNIISNLITLTSGNDIDFSTLYNSTSGSPLYSIDKDVLFNFATYIDSNQPGLYVDSINSAGGIKILNV